MDSHFDIEDVEMIPLDNNKVDSEVVEIIEAAPVMDVRGLEEQEPVREAEQEAVTEVKEAEELPQLPYLSVLRGEASQVITASDWSVKLMLSSHWSGGAGLEREAAVQLQGARREGVPGHRVQPPQPVSNA